MSIILSIGIPTFVIPPRVVVDVSSMAIQCSFLYRVDFNSTLWIQFEGTWCSCRFKPDVIAYVFVFETLECLATCCCTVEGYNTVIIWHSWCSVGVCRSYHLFCLGPEVATSGPTCSPPHSLVWCSSVAYLLSFVGLSLFIGPSLQF